MLVAEQYRLLNDAILPALAEAGIRLLRHGERNAEQRAWVSDYFQREVKPLLTPIGLDPAHPFPQVANKSLNFVVELSGRDAFGRETTIATVKAPRLLPRVIALPRGAAGVDNAVRAAFERHPRASARALRRARDRRLLAVPRHARCGPLVRRGGSEEPAPGARRRIAAAAFRAGGAARGGGGLPGEARAVPAAAVRLDRRRSVSRATVPSTWRGCRR